jgi:hypothetical protein
MAVMSYDRVREASKYRGLQALCFLELKVRTEGDKLPVFGEGKVSYYLGGYNKLMRSHIRSEAKIRYLFLVVDVLELHVFGCEDEVLGNEAVQLGKVDPLGHAEPPDVLIELYLERNVVRHGVDVVGTRNSDAAA